MQSKAATVAEYLASLPEDRRAAIEAVRRVILKNLDKGYVEGMQYGMIGYAVPHSIFPHGYHCDPKQPLPFAGLASQKQHMSLYLMTTYGDGPQWDWFRAAWEATGKKLDMGKCCIRFRRVEDLALDVIAEAIRRVPATAYIEFYVKALASMGKGPDGKPIKVAGASSGKGKRLSDSINPRPQCTTGKPARGTKKPPAKRPK
ncbi:MAG: DUF1801 domain-containing protein [Phycisphaerae bacterium]|nr:DUF1801 domain-containing protein [Phycisphaerae bacterium]